jgi:hypothetical protein
MRISEEGDLGLSGDSTRKSNEKSVTEEAFLPSLQQVKLAGWEVPWLDWGPSLALRSVGLV